MHFNTVLVKFDLALSSFDYMPVNTTVWLPFHYNVFALIFAQNIRYDIFLTEIVLCVNAYTMSFYSVVCYDR